MRADILSVVLEGNSCNTREKNEILKLKEESQNSKNKEIEIDLNYALEEQEEDEAMEEDDSDDNNKTKEISAQPTRKLPLRKAAQRHLFIQPWYHDNVKTKKISAVKTEASPKERPTVRGRGGEKEKVSSESSPAASVSKAKDDLSEGEENEKEVTEKTKTRSRGKIETLNQQNNEARSQDTENHPVNNQVNSRVNIQSKAPLEYHGQDSFGEHEESEEPHVTDTENHKITANKKLFPRGEKIYGCPYECGFVCKPGRRFEVTRHLNSNIINGKARKPSCPVRRKIEVVCRDGTWTKSIKEPVFLGPAVTRRGGEKDKVSSEITVIASISRGKDYAYLEEENEKEVHEKTKTPSRGRIATINQQNNAVVLEGISCNTREKAKILKLNEELKDSKNKEIEIDLNYASEEQEDECQDVGGKAEDKDEAMEQDDSDDNNKSKVTSAQPTRQLLPRKAAQRHLFIQSRHHENVKNEKTSIINKKEASSEERPTVRSRGREKDKVSSESTVSASISRGKDYAYLEEENEKEVPEKTKTPSRVKIATLNKQNNEAKGQDNANRPVNSRVNTRANSKPKVPIVYHGQDSFGEHEESEVPHVTDTENLHITVNKNLSLRGRKVYGCPYECGFVCKPGRRFEVTRHLNSNIMFSNLRKPSCHKRRKMEVVSRDGTWPESMKEPVTGSGRKKDKAAISRAKSGSLAEENEKKVSGKTKTSRIFTLKQQNSEARRQDTENHPVNNRMNRLASYQDKAFLEYPDLVEDILQSIKKLCSLPSRRDYFFQLDKYTGYVDLFEITDPNIDNKYTKFDGPNVTDYFARPRIICRPQFEAFLRREMYGSAAADLQIKYRCPYCFMVSLFKESIERHIRSRKKYGKWRGPACIVRRHKEPNPSGIYESKWPCPKRTSIIEIDCNLVLILIYSQLGIRISGNCLRKKV